MSGRLPIRVEIYDHDHQHVVMEFDRKTERVVFEPQLAIRIGKSMIDAAGECGAELILQLPHPEVSDARRATLITRVNLVMKNLRDRRKDDPFIAAQIVDIVLNGAFD